VKLIKTILSSAVLALASVGAANAGVVVCGNSSLGLRTTTVDPALAGSCYAGMDNLGDPALRTLVNTQYGLSPSSVIVDRDTANTNGGGLSITGVGGGSGTWSFSDTLWNTYDRMFLYFHFGDGQDEPSPSSTTDPDIYIVELTKPDSTGSWEHFDGTDNGRQQFGLSNIALLGFDDGSVPPGGGRLPEPGTASIALLSIGIAGATSAWRRRRNRSA
jgi:hypothetical protein